MTIYVYRPAHPKACENGMVAKEFVEYDLPYGVAPYVISDEMPSLRHMATNRYHTSKAAFRADTKASGCIEFGNETAHLTKPRKPVKLDRTKRRDDIKRTIYELKNGVKRI